MHRFYPGDIVKLNNGNDIRDYAIISKVFATNSCPYFQYEILLVFRSMLPTICGAYDNQIFKLTDSDAVYKNNFELKVGDDAIEPRLKKIGRIFKIFLPASCVGRYRNRIISLKEELWRLNVIHAIQETAKLELMCSLSLQNGFMTTNIKNLRMPVSFKLASQYSWKPKVPLISNY